MLKSDDIESFRTCIPSWARRYQSSKTLKNDAYELSLRECDVGTSARTKICGLDTKSVGWWKIRRSPTVVCHFDGSLANANFTSDREILNCRAIRDGV